MQRIVQFPLFGFHRTADHVGDEPRPRNPGGFVFAELPHVADPGREVRVRIESVAGARVVGRVYRVNDVFGFQFVDEPDQHVAGNLFFIEVQDRFTAAPTDHIADARYFIRGHRALAVYEVEPLQFFVGIVRYFSFAGRRAVDRRVVHQHDHAVSGHLRVDLEERRHMAQRIFERFDAVFRVSRRHAAAVSADDRAASGRIAEVRFDLGVVSAWDGMQPFFLCGCSVRREQQHSRCRPCDDSDYSFHYRGF